MASLKNSIELFQEMTPKDVAITAVMLLVTLGIICGIVWFGENIVGTKLMGLGPYEAFRGVEVTLWYLNGIMLLALVMVNIRNGLRARKFAKPTT